MTITFLGTGTSTGVPVVACNCEVCRSADKRDSRLRTSVMVDVKGQKFIIDCGPDFRYQMIREKVEDISAILFTHGHRDHIAGIDDVRAFNYVLNKTVDIFATQEVINAINKEFPYILTEKRFFGAPQLEFHVIENKPFLINGVNILPVEVLHHKLSVFGFRIGGFTYITDASFISESEKPKAIGSEVLVINALRKSKHISHFSLDEALELIRELKPRKAFITHLSHFIGLHRNIQESLPDNVFLAYDGLKVEIL
ncbi:MAG: MBL fold metallo-hydrolase [Bacteroides sp.]|jgi:phosphoribosyl 1,2-cyclic phosphate phosphodiesterase|nr:MBL fold metallo-hydrolase [Bacteroides sp.]